MVTDEDREKAREVLDAIARHSVRSKDATGWIDAIAAALAEEREKAREQGYDDGYTDGNRDGLAAGMGDV